MSNHTWPATADQLAAVRAIRGMDAGASIEIDRAGAVAEIRVAMADGFDLRTFLDVLHMDDSSPTAVVGTTCDECGHGRAAHRRHDASGIAGLVCGRCSRIPSCELSFA